jgi:cellobiose phosphorylase
MPAAWTTFKIHYRYRQTVYHITISRLPAEAPAGNLLSLDGREISGTAVSLVDDQREHFVELKVSPPAGQTD